MPYTPPANNAVDFTWVGAGPYMPPPGSSVLLTFDPTKHLAAPTNTTQFGTGHLQFAAVGFTPTTFGQAGAALPTFGAAPSTVFGTVSLYRHYQATSTGPVGQVSTPQAKYLQSESASSFGPTAIVPNVRGEQLWFASSIAPATVIPLVFCAVNLECFAMGVPSTTFGTATATIGGGAATNASCSAVPLGPTATFGAVGVGALTLAAVGSTSTALGSHAAQMGLTETAAAPTTVFGAVGLMLTIDASGLYSTNAGTPSAQVGLGAAAFVPRTRFGSPVAVFSSSHQASGSRSGSFPDPSSREAHHATALFIPPQFGRPTVSRSLLC